MEMQQRHLFFYLRCNICILNVFDPFWSFLLSFDLFAESSLIFGTFASSMKKYRIEVTEVLSRIVETEAESEDAAVEKIRKMYRNCEIVLDASDYVETEISVKKWKSRGGTLVYQDNCLTLHPLIAHSWALANFCVTGTWYLSHATLIHTANIRSFLLSSKFWSIFLKFFVLNYVKDVPWHNLNVNYSNNYVRMMSEWNKMCIFAGSKALGLWHKYQCPWDWTHN